MISVAGYSAAAQVMQVVTSGRDASRSGAIGRPQLSSGPLRDSGAADDGWSTGGSPHGAERPAGQGVSSKVQQVVGPPTAQLQLPREAESRLIGSAVNHRACLP